MQWRIGANAQCLCESSLVRGSFKVSNHPIMRSYHATKIAIPFDSVIRLLIINVRFFGESRERCLNACAVDLSPNGIHL